MISSQPFRVSHKLQIMENSEAWHQGPHQESSQKGWWITTACSLCSNATGKEAKVNQVHFEVNLGKKLWLCFRKSKPHTCCASLFSGWSGSLNPMTVLSCHQVPTMALGPSGQALEDSVLQFPVRMM